jgi:hypothetical protein
MVDTFGLFSVVVLVFEKIFTKIYRKVCAFYLFTYSMKYAII